MILLLIVVSVAVREILGQEVANLVKMSQMMVYNVELAEFFMHLFIGIAKLYNSEIFSVQEHSLHASLCRTLRSMIITERS